MSMSASEIDAERRAKWTWTLIILGFLGGSMTMWIYAAVLAVRDPSFVVVPDYHEKALRWDEHQKHLAKQAELGWTLHVLPPTNVDAQGTGMATVFLRGPDGKPLTKIEGTGRVYHHAAASQIQEVELQTAKQASGDSEAGTYLIPLEHYRPGTWQIELQLHQGSVDYEWSQAVDFPG